MEMGDDGGAAGAADAPGTAVGAMDADDGLPPGSPGGGGGDDRYLYALGCFAVLGGGLFGLDIGIIGSVLDMDDFRAKYRKDDWEFGLVSAGMNLGACLFVWCAGMLADRYGRRDTIGAAALVFTVSAFWQGAADSFAVMFVGRLISGGAIGVCATIVPVYLSELAPRRVRGRLVSLQQTAIGFSIMAIYWFAWGVKGTSRNDWRICFYVSAIPSLVLGCGIWFFPRSPRWLLSKGRSEEARAALQKVRRTRAVSAELDEVTRQLAAEQAQELGSARIGEMCSGGMGSITAAAFIVMLFQQVQGINCIMYFGPMVVDGFGLDGNLFTGVVQVFNFGFTFVSVCAVDRWGRRPLLLFGSACMLGTMTFIALVGVADGVTDDDGNHVLQHKGLGYFCIMCFVVYLAGFAATWGPVGWLIPSEVFPLRHRGTGMMIASYANWSSNALLGIFFPSAMKKMGFATYFIFSAMCVGAGVFVRYRLPETKGVPLERMEELFSRARGGDVPEDSPLAAPLVAADDGGGADSADTGVDETAGQEVSMAC